MTQEEVNLIYDYLHENYEYVDGELIRNKDCQYSNKKAGESIGSFFHSATKPSIRCGLKIEGKKFYKPLKHLIFLFHHKYFPRFIEHLDENIVNCRIENLREISGSRVVSKNANIRGYEIVKTKTCLRFRVSISTKLNGIIRKMHFGSYSTKEKAIEVYKLAKDLYLNGATEEEIKCQLKKNFPEIKTRVNNKFLAGAHKSGIHGWKSQININKKTIYLGSFNTPEEAHTAYIKAKEEYTHEMVINKNT